MRGLLQGSETGGFAPFAGMLAPTVHAAAAILSTGVLTAVPGPQAWSGARVNGLMTSMPGPVSAREVPQASWSSPGRCSAKVSKAWPLAIRQVIPWGEVIVIVQVPLVSEAKTSTMALLEPRPMDLRVSP